MLPKKTLIIIGALAAAGTALAAGQERPRLRARSESLKLTTEQRTQIDSLRNEFRKATICRQADLCIVQIELQELLFVAIIDENAVRAKVRQVAGLRTAAFEARMEHQLAISKILTPEQRAQKKLSREGKRFRGRAARGGRRFMRAHPGFGEGPIERPGPIDEEAPQDAP
jgi:Spy/CpxP family protein refolding chaperone